MKTFASLGTSRRSAGFTLLELSMSLAVMGVIGVLVANAYSGSGSGVERTRELAEAEQVRQAVRAFTLANKRLPCPDALTSGLGWENCTAGLVMGYVPYQALGLTQPPANRRGLYGVYRNAGANADLAVAAERSVPADTQSEPGFRDIADLMIGIANGSAQTLSTTQPYLTGNGAQAGEVNCATVQLSNPAFVVVLPTSDQRGAPFDAPHDALLTGARCVVSPGRASSFGFDDVVVAESFHTLMGWLAPYNQ